MADNPTGLTTEQLLVELGRAVLGLGTRIDALGEKLDTINSSLSSQADSAPASVDLTPVLEKLEELKESAASESQSVDFSPLTEQMVEIKEALSSAAKESQNIDLSQLTEPLSAIKDTLDSQAGVEEKAIDFTPLTEKMEELKQSIVISPPDFTPVTDKLEELKEVSRPSEPIDITPVLSKLEEIKQSMAVSPPDFTPVTDKLEELKEVSRPSEPIDMTPALSKLEEIKQLMVFTPTDLSPVITRLDEIRESAKPTEQVDITPLLAKLDELKQSFVVTPPDFTSIESKLDGLKVSIAELGAAEQVKPMLNSIDGKVGEIPVQIIAGLGGKFDEVIAGVHDRSSIAELTSLIAVMNDKMEASGSEILQSLNSLPVKLDESSSQIAESVTKLREATAEVLEKAEASLEKSSDTLDKVQTELESGLKHNTEIAGKMVEITSKFAGQVENEQISDLNSRAVNHFNSGEYMEAEKLFYEALQLSPNNPELLCNSAQVLAAEEKLPEAEAAFRKALEIHPELEPAISGLGLIMVKTGRAEETIEFLKSTMLSGDPSVRTSIAYSRALASTGQHDKAVEHLEACLKSAPDNPELLGELARYGSAKD